MARLPEDASTEMARALQRIMLLALLLLAGILFVLWRADSPRIEALRMAAADRAKPLLELTALPLAKTVALLEDWEALSDLHTQNRDLRREIARLRAWRDAAQQLERENARLRALNNVQLSPRLAFTTAEVLADPRGPFGRSVLVGAGRRDGLEDGSATIDGSGLVGRVVGVGERVARVLLLNDFASRVPVKILPGGQRGILTGDGTPAPRLDFVADPNALSVGARVVTSGDDGVFPPDLTVGVVAGGGARTIRVSLAADYQRLDFVRILRWQREAPGALDPALVGEAPAPMPEPEPSPAAPAVSAPEPAVTGALVPPPSIDGPISPVPTTRPLE